MSLGGPSSLPVVAAAHRTAPARSHIDMPRAPLAFVLMPHPFAPVSTNRSVRNIVGRFVHGGSGGRVPRRYAASDRGRPRPVAVGCGMSSWLQSRIIRRSYCEATGSSARSLFEWLAPAGRERPRSGTTSDEIGPYGRHGP